MPVVVTRGLNRNSQFAKAALKKGRAKLAPKIQAIADDAVRRAEAHIAEDLITDRPGGPTGRRKSGARRLKGSIRVQVIDGGDGTFPFTIRLSSRAEEKKVAALEFGAPAHTIAARNADQLWLPKAIKGNKASQAYTTTKFPAGPEVEHPGNKAYRFMTRGLEEAASAALSRAIRLKRS